LNSQTQLFKAGSFNVKLNHLVIIGVLVLAFSMSFLIRSQPADYGNELMEFDPFFNFRATEYLVENGFTEYFTWHDDKSWYPSGRNISSTSQVMLHTTAAITYQLFGGNLSLYDFTILFPAVIGSLTVIVIFALVRLFAGTTAGLFASLLFAVSLPIMLRGTIGWFKSEPLGIFYGLLGLYLFLSAIKSQNKKIAFLKIISGSIVLASGMSAWGGNQFFVIPIGLFILGLPFVRKDYNFLLWCIPLFVGTFLLITGLFERPGPAFVFGLGGLVLVTPTIFLILCIFLNKITHGKNFVRNGLVFLLSIIVIGSFVIIANGIPSESNFVYLPSFRYVNALFPILTSTDPLVDSVAEHASPTTDISFLFHSVWMIFAGIGIWLLLSKKISQNKIFLNNDSRLFVIIIGITGVYVSSVFIRLELFASISLIILASLALSILTKEIFKIKFSTKKNYLIKTSFAVIILFLFISPLVYPTTSNWINTVDFPATILNGGSTSPPSNDWPETLEWIKLNTPEDSIVASWWDYGYWISTVAERTTLVDNATIGTIQIVKVAQIFMSTPDEAWNLLTEWDVDYVVVYVAAQRLDANSDGNSLYVLNGGGDESKKSWFMRIADVELSKYLESDGRTGTSYFWNETLLGQMIPYDIALYYHEESRQQSKIFQNGFIPISILEINYADEGNYPLKLVHASPSFTNENIDRFNAILVYEVNKNYFPIEPFS
jgi:dolichyl-diphosphooligosaccharide---protein glycosyltransferase